MIPLVRPLPPPLDRLHVWRDGDAIVALDGHPLEDVLDFYHYMPAADRMLLTIRRATGEECVAAFPPTELEALTSAFAPLEFRTCACRCIFCFVDQNPPGLRPSVYVKDEDYRLSFLYGNYVTLTSLGRKGRRRILEQHMSPLYVSVHATDPAVRARMLDVRRQVDVLEILRELIAGGIEVHAQVVLCPGWNDGAVLAQTYRDLADLAPGVASLALVPVGLTAHRAGLTPLTPVTPAMARQVVRQTRTLQRENRRRLGRTFLQLSDEFYLLADAPFPAPAAYADFPQVDNGIGLTVQLREQWRREWDAAGARGRRPVRALTILSGRAGAIAWQREILPLLAARGAPPVEIVPVENGLFGPSVSVAGLLSGADVRRALAALPISPPRCVLLPPRMFNADGLTLDNLGLADLARGLPHRVFLPPEQGLVDFWAAID
jgi:putative radical SAM enzyme (TIGR03279 family)